MTKTHQPQTSDIQGRPYARLSELRVDSEVTVDGGFTCMSAGSRRVVLDDGGELCVRCSAGFHNLSSQMDPGSDALIGIYLAKS